MTADPKLSVWILGDQLLLEHPALLAAEEMTARSKICVVLIENERRLYKLPYQRKKLVLLLSAMRHYTEALRSAGYQVDYVQAVNTPAGLRQHIQSHQPQHLLTMAAAEYGGRQFQNHKLAETVGITITVLPNTQFLVGRYDPYVNERPKKRVVMEYFYRSMRRHFNVLLEADGPVGGQWNYDRDNRKPLPKKGLQTPGLPTFSPDSITLEVMETVDALDPGIGSTTGFDLAVTQEQAHAALEDFVANRLVDFGPYEDAMSHNDAVLFHSVLSPYLNIGLLDPLDVVRRCEHAYREDGVPINSAEGVIRQILGWREYIYWQYWQQMPGLLSSNSWQHARPMPQLFWDAKTELNCLHHVVQRVLDAGYSHHIERLMIICNFCMLAGIDPAAVNNWFLACYIDAYEWVVTPNVIGMGLNADGGKTATKPYIASANYINRMSDYCHGCRYRPKQRTGQDACPFNYLYWNFLLDHEEVLRANPRFGPAVLGLRHLDADERIAVRRQADDFLTQFSYDS